MIDKEEVLDWLYRIRSCVEIYFPYRWINKCQEALDMAIVALNQKPKKGEWLRMSNLSEQDDYRYKCSHCGNVVHHKNKMDLYTFNSWCGRCGSNNGRESEE